MDTKKILSAFKKNYQELTEDQWIRLIAHLAQQLMVHQGYDASVAFSDATEWAKEARKLGYKEVTNVDLVEENWDAIKSESEEIPGESDSDGSD